MRQPLNQWDTPIGENRLNRVALRAALDAKLARDLVRIAEETAANDGTLATTRHATLAGDERRLRGWPCVGMGIPGAINGTIPHRVR